MRKFANLEQVLRKDFKSVWNFAKESKIPISTLSMLINGKYGSDEVRVKARVRDEIRKLRPKLDLSRIWDVTEDFHQKHVTDVSTVKNGFRITVDVKLNEKGELTIAPFVEGY